MTVPLSAGSNGASGTINVLIVAANAVTRSCIAAALDGVVEGLIHATHDLDSCFGTRAPDVVIFPSAEPQASALLADLKGVGSRWPHAALIVLADLNGFEPLLRVLAAGAQVVLPTSAEGEAIALAIRLIRHGLAVVPGELIASAGRYPSSSSATVTANSAHLRRAGGGAAVLTQRQRQVLQLLAQGLSNKAIAARLEISESTVKVHIRAIMAQSGVTSRTQIVAHLLAGENGSSILRRDLT